MIAEQICDRLAVLDQLRGDLERTLKALDAGCNPLRHRELAGALDEVMAAAANLRVFLPQPQPGNEAARYSDALDHQRQHRSQRAELAASVIDNDGPLADRAVSRP
jgi:hypothetical protein